MIIGKELVFNGRVNHRFIELCKINDMVIYMREGQTDYYDRLFVDIGNKNMYFVCYKEQIGVLNSKCMKDVIDNAKNHIVLSSQSKELKINLGVAEFFNVRPQAEVHNKEVASFILDKERNEFAQKERARKEKERQKALDWERELSIATIAYKDGKSIETKEFVGLCKKYDIVIPIKTLGAINKYASQFSNKDINFYGCNDNSMNGAFRINEKLAKKLNCCYNEEDEEGEIDSKVSELFGFEGYKG